MVIKSSEFSTQERPGLKIKKGDLVWASPAVYHWPLAPLALSEQVIGQKIAHNENGMVKPSDPLLKLTKIALIAALTAGGDMGQLKTALIEGLEAGLTINEIKEVLIHTSAYAGFPRALNGLNAFIAVLDEREKAGLKDEYGPLASPVVMGKSRYEYGQDVLAKLRDPAFKPGPAGSPKPIGPVPRYETFTPIIETLLKEHIFADLFSRDVLDYESREIATVGVISNLKGANEQLRAHIGLALNQGVTAEQLKDIFQEMGPRLGQERADNALAVLRQVMESPKNNP
ncbi:MAG: carboxymuconolactone decarboxylase family protein [Deltaproteobacteria bacterium]|nr:carboxymuconolactone decarboxylase family protein [Deltaproteobacteria bacterium]